MVLLVDLDVNGATRNAGVALRVLDEVGEASKLLVQLLVDTTNLADNERPGQQPSNPARAIIGLLLDGIGNPLSFN